MALDLVDVAMRLVEAKSETERAEQEKTKSQEALRAALATMESRVRRILKDGDENPQRGYEVAFLDEALRDIHEADRRHEVDCTACAAAQRREDLLQGFVDALKEEDS